jgi:hypothetical protein
MIADLDTSYCSSSHNGRPALANSGKTPERSPWELLAWAILEQAVDDLAVLCRYGIITERGKCLPWPRSVKFHCGYYVKVNACIAGMRGPHDHRELKAFFNSHEAQEFCDLIGCRLPAKEIWASTIKNHGGLK